VVAAARPTGLCLRAPPPGMCPQETEKSRNPRAVSTQRRSDEGRQAASMRQGSRASGIRPARRFSRGRRTASSSAAAMAL